MSKETQSNESIKGDSKMQGNWRTCARTGTEKSGLKRREYEVQQSFTTEDGNRVFPDVINLLMVKK
jgi:DNA recombination protein RmuC